MARDRNGLLVFMGSHSLLIGLFPFYIPVYLYSAASSLDPVFKFVGITGLGFCLWLFVWNRLQNLVSPLFLVILSYISEIVLVVLFFFDDFWGWIYFAGFMNGVFNCSFWMYQRIMFLNNVVPSNSGKTFGNLQLVVMIFLKAGIFIGGWILENIGISTILLFSVFCSLAGAVCIYRFYYSRDNRSLFVSRVLAVKDITTFTDRYNSRWIFSIDGVFLYLESYFWIISLYLIVKESFWKLGLLVIALSIFFGVLFWFIKDNIDSLPRERIYRFCVILYAFSWLLRSMLSQEMSVAMCIVGLSIITFCTSLFRLSFNKRFFDAAKRGGGVEYILYKSYYSQFFLLPLFCVPLFFPSRLYRPEDMLSIIYLLAAGGALVFLCYRDRSE